MKKTNLNAELREWLSVRLSEVLGDNSDNIGSVEFNIHEAKEDIIRSFYEYQLVRGWLSMLPTISWSLRSKNQRSLRASILHFLTKKIFFKLKYLHIPIFCCIFAAGFDNPQIEKCANEQIFS